MTAEKNKLLIRGLFILSIFFSASVFAERYALLVGVSEYDEPSYSLGGPENDVSMMRKLLIQQWDFKNKNIIVLKNSQATRKEIKNSLKKMTETLNKDDYFVFYFSGHGTSYFDPCGRNSLPQDSGALVAYDTQNKGGLFITKDDLRPYITQMDHNGVKGLGLLDACFSGNSYRSAQQPATKKTSFKYRYIQPSILSKELTHKSAKTQCQGNIADNTGIEAKPYPYQNFMFITASSAYEKALDLDQGLESLSLDGLPHGAFSNSLLKALNQEQAYLTHEQLFSLIENDMEANDRINHSPLMVPSDDDVLANKPHTIPAENLYKSQLFALSRAADTTDHIYIKPKPEVLVINVPQQYKNLQKVVNQTEGLILLTQAKGKPAHYIIAADKTNKQQLLLTDIHGIPLFRSQAITLSASEKQLSNILKQQVWLNRFRKVIAAQQPFNLRIKTIKNNHSRMASYLPEHCINKHSEQDNRYTNETFIECDILKLTVKPELESFVVILNLTSDGQFALLYPYNDNDVKQLSTAQPFSFDNIVGPPFGMDSIVVFAFQSAQDPLYQLIEEKRRNNKHTKIKPGSLLHQTIVERFMNTDGRHAQQIKNIFSIQANNN